jgi:hypothetical protein
VRETSVPVGQAGVEVREGRLDDVEQVRHGLVVAELGADLDDERQVPLQAAHPRLRHDEGGTPDPRLGDARAEGPPRHDLGLYADRLAALGRPGDGEALVEGVEAAARSGGEPDEALAPEPELELHRQAGPILRHPRLGGEERGEGGLRPEVADGELVDPAVSAAKRHASTRLSRALRQRPSSSTRRRGAPGAGRPSRSTSPLVGGRSACGSSVTFYATGPARVAAALPRPIYFPHRGRDERSTVEEKVYRSELTPNHFLRRSAYMFPDKTAVVYGERRYTYGELEGRVNRLASRLKDAGLEKGDRVAFLCFNTPPMLDAHFGVPLAASSSSP